MPNVKHKHFDESKISFDGGNKKQFYGENTLTELKFKRKILKTTLLGGGPYLKS